MIRLPGICIVCREPVVWNGKRWKDYAQRSGSHRCPVERPTCGAWMPVAKERCVRRPGHTSQHLTEYAVGNRKSARTGRWDVMVNARSTYNDCAGTSTNRIPFALTPHLLLVPAGAASSRSEGRD